MSVRAKKRRRNARRRARWRDKHIGPWFVPGVDLAEWSHYSRRAEKTFIFQPAEAAYRTVSAMRAEAPWGCAD